MTTPTIELSANTSLWSTGARTERERVLSESVIRAVRRWRRCSELHLGLQPSFRPMADGKLATIRAGRRDDVATRMGADAAL